MRTECGQNAGKNAGRMRTERRQTRGAESRLRTRDGHGSRKSGPDLGPLRKTGAVSIAALRSYFRSSSASLTEVRATTWSEGVDEAAYGVGGSPYQTALLEQYKLYVEMTDRVSARRATVNTFFLSLNATLGTGVSFVWGLQKSSPWLLLFPLLVLLVLSGVWFCLIKSYRQLNTAKFAVIAVLEEKLPASPYWRAEWKALGEGLDRSRYWPMSQLEQGIPVVFAVLYVVGFVVMALAHR